MDRKRRVRWRTENAYSDLVVRLAERDIEPFRRAFNLPDGCIELRRELVIRGGRCDIVVFVDGVPWAVLEVKLAADAHGEQFAVYAAWADANGVLPEHRYIVGPTTDPVPGVPPTWSQRFTIESLLELWQESPDGEARAWAVDARDLIRGYARQSAGPADEVTEVLADVLRLRRVHHQVWSKTSEEIWFGDANRSTKGAPNIRAWRAVGCEMASVEVQRVQPFAGAQTPFAVTMMVSELAADDSTVVRPALAALQERWLAPRHILNGAAPEIRRLVVAPDADGLKSRRTGGNGHPRYYGYKTTGFGTRMQLCSEITSDELALIYGHVVDHLLTYQPAYC